MDSLFSAVFGLAYLVLGIKGLLDGNIGIGLGMRTGGGDDRYSITLTGNRSCVFSVILIVAGLMTGAVEIALFQRVNQLTYEKILWDVGVICMLTLFGVGSVCALWEKMATSKHPPNTQDE